MTHHSPPPLTAAQVTALCSLVGNGLDEIAHLAVIQGMHERIRELADALASIAHCGPRVADTENLEAFRAYEAHWVLTSAVAPHDYASRLQTILTPATSQVPARPTRPTPADRTAFLL